MSAHVIEIGTEGPAEGTTRRGARWFLPRIYWWRCSCCRVGPNKTNPRSARNGGARHVAAMEKR
jgi:hypothetical protein